MTAEGIVPLTDEKRNEIRSVNHAFATKALRVLAFAYRLHEPVENAAGFADF